MSQSDNAMITELAAIPESEREDLAENAQLPDGRRVKVYNFEREVPVCIRVLLERCPDSDVWVPMAVEC
jgi:hypothetical protein